MAELSPTCLVADPSSAKLALFIEWATALSTENQETLENILDDGYSFELLPKSYGRIARNKEQTLAAWGSMAGWMIDLKFVIQEVVESATIIVLHATGTAKSSTGVPFANEYMFIVESKEQVDGKLKIIRMKEFVDSKVTSEFFPAEKVRQEELKKKASV